MYQVSMFQEGKLEVELKLVDSNYLRDILFFDYPNKRLQYNNSQLCSQEYWRRE